MKIKKTTNLKNIKKKKPKKQTKPNTRKKPTQKKTTLKKETTITRLNKWLKKKGINPIISIILLIIVSVVLVLSILSWGKNYVVEGVKDTKDILQIKPSDASFYVHTKSINEGVIQFNYLPPTSLAKEEIFIKSYIVSNIPEMIEQIEFDESIKLSNTNILELPCLYEYSSTTPELYVQLITTNNTYIDIKIKDQGMVCISSGDGSENNPKVICTASDLNSIREEDNLSKNYILGKDIDLGCFSKKNDNGWMPIGNFDPDLENPTGMSFTGTFDGKNHTIKNIDINGTDYLIAGFFGCAGYGSEIRNLKLKNVSINGGVMIGGLVGVNFEGIIENSSVIGKISGETDIGEAVRRSAGFIENNQVIEKISKNNNVNGIVEKLAFSDVEPNYTLEAGTINFTDRGPGFDVGIEPGFDVGIGSDALDTIWEETWIGGLVGANVDGIIKNSYAEGKVSGIYVVGGLVGANSGTIENSYATGDINGRALIGGLVAVNLKGSIKNSYTTGNVSGEEKIGGLIGSNMEGNIENSYATGNVSGVAGEEEGIIYGLVGGLVGLNEEGYIQNSYATGNVNGMMGVGGLVGGLVGDIENSYATGNVNGMIGVGGLVGANEGGNIQNSYTISDVSGEDESTGGLVGVNIEGNVERSYWNIDIYEEDNGFGEGKTTIKMKDINTYTIDLGENCWNFTDIWAMNSTTNNGYPYLRMKETPIEEEEDGDGWRK